MFHIQWVCLANEMDKIEVHSADYIWLFLDIISTQSWLLYLSQTSIVFVSVYLFCCIYNMCSGSRTDKTVGVSQRAVKSVRVEVKIMGPIKSKVFLVLWAYAFTPEKRHGHKFLAHLYLPLYKQGDGSQSHWVQWSCHHVKHTQDTLEKRQVEETANIASHFHYGLI